MANRINKIISTKANTLYAMKNLIKKASIEEMYILRVEDFWRNKNQVCTEIMEKFGGCRIVVRSSSTQEDCMKSSNAGHYKSILDVDSASRAQIVESIEAVIQSYEKDIKGISNEQVLIQRQAIDVCVSGVVFSRDLKGKRPYYLVNYDDLGSTDSVTSGRGGKTLWIARNVSLYQLEERWRNLITAVTEVESIIEDIPLDIEFAIDSHNQVILFQVRPLAAGYREGRYIDDYSFFARKGQIRREYEEHLDAITGKPMKLSDMAFWNPSEIIGSNPRALDYSLYREIITHHAWNEGIRTLGYRAFNEDLMYQVGNKPYINLTYSYYSLIPASIPEPLALRLVQYYQTRLEEDLSAHDKIEFEIIFSSYDFMTEENSKRLLRYGFTEEERKLLVREVKKLTIDAVMNQEKILKEDLEALKRLENCREEIEKLLYQDVSIDRIIDSILTLLKEIRTNGTPQFARQARLAFIARAFLRTLVDAGYYTSENVDTFMQGISTVSSEFNDDFERFSEGLISREEFNFKYGHLRSGTYDIRSDRYDAMNFRPAPSRIKKDKVKIQKDLDISILTQALEDTQLDVPAERMAKFWISAIEQREYFKFEFTKSLSMVLELIRKLGSILEIRTMDLSWLCVDDFKLYESGCDPENLKKLWMKLITKRRRLNHDSRLILLPEVILSVASVDVIPVYEARPNFITAKTVEGEVVLLDEEPDADITGKIVVVPKADPGYEWIFTKNIKGFITKYGGAASHMAIRCAEFNIPAAIGCGEKIYDTVSQLDYLEMDCRNGLIKEGIQYTNLHALITQREGVNDYGDPTDILEAGYVEFYESIGFIPRPVANHTKNFERLFDEKIDLLIVVGGGALGPQWYDRKHEETVQPYRDKMEEKLIHYCVNHGIPIIGTCRGMQYVNVLFGGKLAYHPDLPCPRERGEDHKVRLLKENRSIYVNNYHKDVIFEDALADCFEPLAIDEDNHTIEAYQSEQMKILGVQWHPERKFGHADGIDETRRLVRDFISKFIH